VKSALFKLGGYTNRLARAKTKGLSDREGAWTTLGLLTLGAFVGAIATLGVRYVNFVESWQKILLAILPAVLSGVAIAFVDRFKYSPALGAYPLRLIVAFLWTYGGSADPRRMENRPSGEHHLPAESA
jgi:hypothetical protein